MNAQRIAFCLPLFLVVLASGTSDGQAIQVSSSRLQASRDTTRIRAFYEMVTAADEHDRYPTLPPTSFLASRAKKQDDLAVALIALLERENAFVSSARPGSLSGEYLGTYYTDLLVTVARMEDPRALDALIPGIGTSDVVRRTVAGFGENAVRSLTLALSDPNRDTRAGSVLTMKRMLLNRKDLPLTDQATNEIRSALLRATAGHDDAFVRTSAVDALMPLADDGIRVEMQRIAATDTVTGYAPPGRPTPFPVREAARNWLAKHPDGR